MTAQRQRFNERKERQFGKHGRPDETVGSKRSALDKMYEKDRESRDQMRRIKDD